MSPLLGLALTTWSNAAARRVITKIANRLFAPRALVFMSVALMTGSSVSTTIVTDLRESLVTPSCARARDDFSAAPLVEHVRLPKSSRVHLRSLLSRSSSSCWQGVELDLHQGVGCSLSEQFTFKILSIMRCIASVASDMLSPI